MTRQPPDNTEHTFEAAQNYLSGAEIWGWIFFLRLVFIRGSQPGELGSKLMLDRRGVS